MNSKKINVMDKASLLGKMDACMKAVGLKVNKVDKDITQNLMALE